MIYDDLLIDKNKFDHLLSYSKNDRIQNAYIFHGDNGIGKEAYAIEFFALINCKSTLEDGSACRNCSSCKKIISMQHELLTITLPFPRSKNISKNDSSLKALSDKDLDSLTQQLKLKGTDPYYKIKLEKANTILINSIKDIKKNISLSIPRNSYRLHLILNAEKLCFPNQESANALLKILEEPTENNFFILITSDISKLLDTIISRCTSIFFNPIEFEKQYNYLINKGIDQGNAEIITRLSFGNISYSLQISKNFDDQMEIMKQIITSLLNNDLNSWKNKLSIIRDKDIIAEYLNFLSLFIRDVNNHQNKIQQNMNFSHFKQLVIDFSSTHTIIFEDCITTINDTINNIYANGYIPLMITGLFIELQKIFKDGSTFRSQDLQNIEYH